jgi:hypothetical protein
MQEYKVSIFRVEEYAKQEKRDELIACFMPVSSLAYFSAPKMEATVSSETSFDFQQMTRRYSPENRTLSNYRCENLRSCPVWRRDRIPPP